MNLFPRRAEPLLSRKLLAWLLGPLLALLALDTVVTSWTSLRLANLAYDRALQEVAREVVLHVRPNGAGPTLEMTAQAERILLVDPDDRVFFRVGAENGARIGGEAALPAPPRAPRRGGPPVFYEAQLQGLPVRVLAAWMPLEEGPPAQVLVQVAETLNKRERLARDIRFNALVPQLLLIALAVAAVYVGVARGLRPLGRLRQAVSDRSHLDLSPIDPRDVPGEVRPLVAEVNELMTRLSGTLDFQNRFIADAAHQLKTPVSGLKAQIELALRESDPERVRHSLAQLYVSADRLSRLVRQLLSLARNEPGATEPQLAPLDLEAFALEIAMEWVPPALQRGIDLGFEGTQGRVEIAADADRLRELVHNLVDNAVRYSQQNGRVTVAVVRCEGGGAQLSISDDGPAIPVEERARIFERFHRLLGTPADGSGLGLAIASEIARAHGATITLAEDVDGIGNTFSVLFPAPPAGAAPGA